MASEAQSTTDVAGEVVRVLDSERIFAEAARVYIDGCRARIEPFVRRHFGVKGAMRVHRRAAGLDLVRAPTNLLLAVPNIAARLSEPPLRRLGARRSADWLSKRDLLLKTAVDREIEWLIMTELLRLPLKQPGRESFDDGLAEAILAHPDLEAAVAEAHSVIAARKDDGEFAARLDGTMRTYTGSRAAAADMAAALTNVGAGAVLVNQLTPSALSLGPAIAALIAHQTAVVAFPLGAGLGGLWYGLFPVVPSAGLVVGVTGGMLGAIAAVAAFAGVATDPVQRWTGTHRRRLEKLVDSLEADLLGPGSARFKVRGPYVARLLDLIECLRVVYRAAH